jgi:hypothetical protein
LIAVFVLALMSFMIWQLTNNTYRGTQKASKYDDVYQYARMSLRRVTDDLSMAFLFGQNFQGKLSDGTVAYESNFLGEDAGDSDAIYFLSFSGTRMMMNERKSDQVEIGYFVDKCPGSDGKVSCLMRRESAFIDKNLKENADARPIAEGIKRFNVEYFDPSKQEWRSGWTTQEAGFNGKLPLAARVMISFVDPLNEREELMFEAATTMPLSAGVIDF